MEDIWGIGVTFRCLFWRRVVGDPEVRVLQWRVIRPVPEPFGVRFAPFDVVVQPVECLED